MANWAKLQEDLTGLPVVKRARHGIHFDKGNGEIVANFSGKPCHYEDKGVWKPIDTTLLLGADGYYGCPHSPVKVHKDGRVKVDKSDYSQFTKLPGSPIGKVDGNRIVREFPGGRQYLYVTEDGFREEIVVDKPTFPLEKFIGKTSGTLPSAYKASPQTAVDANGDVFEITSDTKAFGDWLEGAVYPVTIDPDFSVQPDAAAGKDSWIREVLPNNNYGTWNTFEISTYAAGDYSRGVIQFDLSSLPAGITVSSGILTLTRTSYNGNVLSGIYRLLLSWTEAKVTWNSRNGTDNWNAGGANGSGTDRYSSPTDTNINVDVNNKLIFTVTTDIQLFADGTSNYGWVCAPVSANNNAYYVIESSNGGTESYRPVLSVTYTAGSAGVPKHFLHYARLRSN